MKNIRDYSLEELENELVELGEKKFRAKQIFAWLFRNVESFDEMTDLSKELIQKLKDKEILEKGDVVVLSGGAKTCISGMTKKYLGGIVRI